MADTVEPSSSSTPSTTSNEKCPRNRPTLLSYDEIPKWLQDNSYILHGYRPESNFAHACFASWRYLHNETINIYSHLVPAIFFLIAEGFIYYYFKTHHPEATIGDHLIFAFFFLTAATCLGMSATYHTLMNHSLKVSNLWLRLDFAGIVVLTLGDFVSGIYMGFYCELMLRKIYWTMIITLGSAAISILINPRFQGRRWRTFRVCTFIVTGLSGLAPLAHGIKIFGFAQMEKQSGMVYYIIEGLLLVLGTLFCMTRIPEALKPGRFDLFGCSHQIFHVLMVVATAVHLAGILIAFEYNSRYRHCGT